MFMLALSLFITFHSSNRDRETTVDNLFPIFEGQHFDTGYEIARELVVDGRTMRLEITPEMEAATINQELIDVGGVPMLITTYAFDGFEYEVFQLMHYAERSILSVLPPEQEITSRQFAQEFMELYASRSGNQDTQGMQDVVATVSSGRYFRERSVANLLGSSQTYHMAIQFDWEMRDNTNWGNPLWDWQRVRITRLDVHVFPLSIRNGQVDTTPIQNKRSVVIDVVARTHGMAGISYTLSWPPSVSISPANNTTTTILSREFPNAVGVMARIVEHGNINLDRTVNYPLSALPTASNWVSLEAYGSFWMNSGFHSRLIRTGITFRRTATFRLETLSYIP